MSEQPDAYAPVYRLTLPPNIPQSSDGSTDIYFGPSEPEGQAGNWLQTLPGRGYFVILRLYNPLQPYFDKTWRPSEVEPVWWPADTAAGLDRPCPWGGGLDRRANPAVPAHGHV